MTLRLRSGQALKEKLDQLPATPGVYLFKDVVGDVIYVGKAASLRNRVRSYFQTGANLHFRTQSLVERVSGLDFVVAESELEALVLEFNLIQRYRPRFNVRYRDDKSYPYIRIDLREPFPTLCVIRQRAVADDGARYFGPYPSTRAMWQTIALMRRIFGICQRLIMSAKRRSGCTWNPEKAQRQRPCLDYYMKRCLGPCAGVVTQEEYHHAVSNVVNFLEGKQDLVLAKLQKEMEAAAGDMRFEQAARLRDQIHAIEMTLAKQRVVTSRKEDLDVMGLALRQDSGCVVVMQVRRGRVVGQDEFMLQGVSGVSAEEVLNEFAKQHYQKSMAAPRRVLLSLKVMDAALVEQLLTTRRGAQVKLHTPARGEGKRLLGMASENAEHHLRAVLEQESTMKRKGQEAVADLQEVLSLPVSPRRIEAYDISNIQGKFAVGSMIVFEEGLPKNSDYRRFRIQLGEEPDDYAMMHEVLSRRLKAAVSGNVKFAHLPDLVLVDGGAGQLNVALKALGSLDMHLPVASLAKEHEQIYLPQRSAPISLPEHSRTLHLLQQVRDEAHRFAISYHRTLRAKETRESVLDKIPGIGEKRKQKLLTHFRTLDRLRQATVMEISFVAGCSLSIAKAVAVALNKTTHSMELSA